MAIERLVERTDHAVLGGHQVPREVAAACAGMAATTYMRWDIAEKLAESARTLDASTQLLQRREEKLHQRPTDGADQLGPTTSP